jgi:SAM-dependent methyltransferase
MKTMAYRSVTVAKHASGSVNRRSTLIAAPLLGFASTCAPRRAVAASASYPETVEDVLKNPNFPPEWPYPPDAFQRFDETSDGDFYAEPRFVTHIDDMAIKALTEYYEKSFPPSGTGASILDMCSSWISHYPAGYEGSRISGTGMNEKELARNSVLTDYSVRDLNIDPTLPYADNTFDVVTNTVSIDYLTKPLDIMREVHRVLKPGGLAIFSFSNRCFPTKAVSVWTSTGDLDHAWIVGSYIHYAGGFEPPMAKEITKKGPLGQKGDPMYVVFSRKQNIDL